MANYLCMWRRLQFKVVSKRQISEKHFMAILFTFRVFARNLLECVIHHCWRYESSRLTELFSNVAIMELLTQKFIAAIRRIWQYFIRGFELVWNEWLGYFSIFIFGWNVRNLSQFLVECNVFRMEVREVVKAAERVRKHMPNLCE